MSVFYEDLAPAEFRARLAAAPIAYVPLGTLEWHCEHLPLGTDGLLARGLFARVAREVGGIVLPSLHLGPDRRIEEPDGTDLIGMDYDATVDPPRRLDGSAYWADDDLYAAILEATVRNLARAGFRIITAHGHGPSARAFMAGMPGWRDRYGVRCHTAWPTGDPEPGGFMTDHAAANETSILMALHPDLVHMDRLPADPGEWPLGVGGPDPRTHATREAGEAILARATQDLARRLREDLAALEG